jgi:hypothetical protein
MLNMRAPRDAADVSVIKFSPYTMQHVHSNSFHCLSYVNLQFIEVSGHWLGQLQLRTCSARWLIWTALKRLPDPLHWLLWHGGPSGAFSLTQAPFRLKFRVPLFDRVRTRGGPFRNESENGVAQWLQTHSWQIRVCKKPSPASSAPLWKRHDACARREI